MDMNRWRDRMGVPFSFLRFGNGIQYFLSPLLVVRPDNHDAKAVLIAFHLHTLGIIDVQIDSESRRKLRRRILKAMRSQTKTVPVIVDDTIDMDAMQQQPAPDIERRTSRGRIYPDAASPATQLPDQGARSDTQRLAQPSMNETRHTAFLGDHMAMMASQGVIDIKRYAYPRIYSSPT
jgi:hypothetical protein